MKETLGERLKEARNKSGLTQLQVVEILGIDKISVSLYENDRNNPSLDNLVRLANIYKTSVDYLLGRTKCHTLLVNNVTDKEFESVKRMVNAFVREIKIVRENKKDADNIK